MHAYKGFSIPEILVHVKEASEQGERLDLLGYDQNRERSSGKPNEATFKSSPLLHPLRGGQSCSSIVKIWGMNPSGQVCWQNVEACNPMRCAVP